MSKSTNFKKLGLRKAKNPGFTKANFSKPEFFTLKDKKDFLYPWKAITKSLILRHFNLKHSIRIEIDALRYAIGQVLS